LKEIHHIVILIVIREVEAVSQIKTGISLDSTLFEAGEQLARKLRTTRSGLYARALTEFIERERSQELLNELNAAYDSSPDPEDDALIQGIRRTARRIGDTWE
jgi:hypothetical protein